MAPSALTLSIHSVSVNSSRIQPAATTTTLPCPSLVNQSNTISVHDLLFGVLAILLAVASVLLAYFQLLHMRKHTKHQRPGIDMVQLRKLVAATTKLSR